ncbi:tRNA (adenosine(37)-N6)-dimethylallyltransferase MiaA [Euzebya tangerina]|uniref:tRNA (adenosine(37)-N6)-dimethylallyltransferase MiaA n=1 Tax=Euzebya tangerina TaxID=591198 RepID=UPI000E31B43D|nr:tRNA (adenosine(37)-N6)-dimethylallyltransferase MiaA [Euzebya tangerina]
MVLTALIGPTGSGKSQLAMQAARATGAAIVAIDAFTVYRGMDVGTAKPTREEQAAVDHHMIDLLGVEEECTVQWFQQRARAVIADLREQERPVLLVGGSGLYFRAVVDPLEFPPTDPDTRARIQVEVEADVLGGHARLQAIDPAAADRMDPSNSRRIIRALEVIELTGRPFSSYRTAWDDHTSIYRDLTVLGTAVGPDQLRDRIAARTQRMLDRGWVEECRSLIGRDLSSTAAQAIGYAELMAWLATDEQLPLAPVAERIAIRTRQFARRQRRWFAADPRVQWLDPSERPHNVITALKR